MIRLGRDSMLGFLLILCIFIQYPSASIIKVYGSNFQAKELDDVLDIVNTQTRELASTASQYTKLPTQLRATSFTSQSTNMLKGKRKWSCLDCEDTNPRFENVLEAQNPKNHFDHHKKQNFPNFIPLSNNVVIENPLPPTESITEACNFSTTPTGDVSSECHTKESMEKNSLNEYLYHVNLSIDVPTLVHDKYPIANATGLEESYNHTFHTLDHPVPSQDKLSNVSTTIEYVPWVISESLVWYAFLAGIILTIFFVFLSSSLSSILYWLPNYLINRLEQYVLHLFHHEQYAEAIQVLEYAVPCLMIWRGAQHTDTSGFQHFLAKAYSHHNLPNKAIALLQSILPVYRHFGEDQYVAKVYEDSGIVFRQLTHYPEALHALHQAMRIFYEESYSSHHNTSSATSGDDAGEGNMGAFEGEYSNIFEVQGGSRSRLSISHHNPNPNPKHQHPMTTIPEEDLLSPQSPIVPGPDSSSASVHLSHLVDDDEEEEEEPRLLPLQEPLDAASTASSSSSSSTVSSSCDLCRHPPAAAAAAMMTTTVHAHVEYNENIVYDINDDDSDRPFDFFLSPLSDRYGRVHGGGGSVTSQGSGSTGGGTRSSRSTRSAPRTSRLNRSLEEDFLHQTMTTTATTTLASETITTIATAERLTLATATLPSSTPTSHHHPHHHHHHHHKSLPMETMENEFGMKLFQDLLTLSSLDIGRLCYELGNVYELMKEYYNAVLFYHHAQFIFRKVYHEQALLSPDLLLFERNIISEEVHQEIERKIEEKVQVIWQTVQEEETLKEDFQRQKKLHKLYPVMNYYTIYHIDQHPDAVLPNKS